MYTKIIKTISFILIVAMALLCFGSCEESPALKKERFNKKKKDLKAKIETTVCTTPEEFGDLMVEVSSIVMTANADLGRRYVNRYAELSVEENREYYCSDITLALRENKSIMKYFEAPYTDKVPDLLHSKGLYASDIIGLYRFVAEDDDILYYAVNGWFPLAGYVINTISKDEIAEKLKKELRNPESLQIHEIECLQKSKEMITASEMAENKCSDLHIGCVIVDYSAQNGYGGYNRKKAWFDVFTGYYGEDCFLYLKTSDYSGSLYPDGYSFSSGTHINPPDWEVNN